ncbi:uncharacterized protein (TIGR01244 family) [Hasllibacter halocynthiae]|uniref:Uncharacterized protein (TIGR01244 family) n=2 Tax=Hasllibacter halocynthiae TaxID=595589 RepID=A0A2T0X7E8_9RHOB|nr:TIGR01244 family sulfur transferase [Hasllibacter halocynthiae]PRY94868.1 uncharacterized protein (TIGR01244 family) [Hasllibacter halocynthiae]
MPIRPLTDRHAVSPQIEPEDVPVLAAEGVTAILCNRPDGEVPAGLRAADLRAAAEAAGLAFAELPAHHAEIGPELAARQRAEVARLSTEGSGTVLAYCASGTRCTILWALGEAGHMPEEEIIANAAAAGYDLGGLRGRLG